MKNNRVDFSAAVENEMKLILPSLSVNEGTARAAVAAFCAQLNPTAVELADIILVTLPVTIVLSGKDNN